MRPLIEILEDERTLMQKRESIMRYLVKTDDEELIDILTTRERIVKRDLDKTRDELREYITELLSIQN